jgi:hypothetical protein
MYKRCTKKIFLNLRKHAELNKTGAERYDKRVPNSYGQVVTCASEGYGPNLCNFGQSVLPATIQPLERQSRCTDSNSC